MAAYQPAAPMPREFFKQPYFQRQRHPPELRQPGLYADGKGPSPGKFGGRSASGDACRFFPASQSSAQAT